MLLYCMEINKGASAAPVVRGQPLFTGTRWELFTNIRYEQRLCHEYRAGLEAGCLIMGGSRYEGPWKSSLMLASPQNIFCFLLEGDPPAQKEIIIPHRLSSSCVYCMTCYHVGCKSSCVSLGALLYGHFLTHPFKKRNK